MVISHLDDDQIQAYLDKGSHQLDSEIENHLRICTSCNEKVHLYKEIYQELESDTVPVLSKNFSKNIMNELGAEESKSSIFNEYSLSAVAFIAAFTALILFFKPFGFLERFFSGTTNHIAELFTSLEPIFRGRIDLVAGIILILILIEIIDYKILRPRLKQSQ